MKKDKENIKAIHDDNLIELLTNLDLIDNLNASKLNCKFCKEVISLDNLSAIFPDSGSIKLSCDHPKCISKLNRYLNEK